MSLSPRKRYRQNEIAAFTIVVTRLLLSARARVSRTSRTTPRPTRCQAQGGKHNGSWCSHPTVFIRSVQPQSLPNTPRNKMKTKSKNKTKQKMRAPPLLQGTQNIQSPLIVVARRSLRRAWPPWGWCAAFPTRSSTPVSRRYATKRKRLDKGSFRPRYCSGLLT